VRATCSTPALRYLSAGLIVLAIGFGNSAYQTGNVAGAAVALQTLTGIGVGAWSLVVGLGSFLILFGGRYKFIERLLIALVVLMSLAFLITAAITRPSVGPLVRGLLVPSLPDGSLTTVLGLIGTTIVPYNLFLHASSAREKWPPAVETRQALRESRWDTIVAVAVGGLVTGAIVTTAAAAFFWSSAGQAASGLTAAAMARQLEPALGGVAATWLFCLGLFAAGLTSAITAPLAAAYAITGAMNWQADLRGWRFRLVWMLVLVIGTALAATLGKSPEQTILVAQVANGFLLPLIALFLLLAVNQQTVMGKDTNTALANVLGAAIVLVVAGLAVYKLVNLG
jgi:manganese transport protein